MHLSSEKKQRWLLRGLQCLIVLFSALFIGLGVVGVSNNRETLQSMVIAQRLAETGSRHVSGYIEQEGKRAHYYHSGLFYATQTIATYWDYDENKENNIFFRYRETDGGRTVSIYDGSDMPKLYGVDLLVPLAREPLHMFGLELLCGNEVPVNTHCCEFTYVSESLAAKLVAPFESLPGETFVEKVERILLYDEAKGNDLSLLLNRASEFKTTKTCIYGVISKESMGPYASFVGEDFITTRWSADLQTTIYDPNLFVLFGTDPVRNSVYLSQFARLYEGMYWHFYMADELGGTIHGAFHQKLMEVSALSKGPAAVALYVISIILGLGLFGLWLWLSFIYLRDRYNWAYKRARRICCIQFLFAFFTAVLSLTLASTSFSLYREGMFSLDGLNTILLILIGVGCVLSIRFFPRILLLFRPLPTDHMEI